MYIQAYVYTHTHTKHKKHMVKNKMHDRTRTTERK